MSGQVEAAAFRALLSDDATRDFLLRLHQEASMAQIIGSVAHQLRNPLNSILNGAQLLEERGADPDLRDRLVPVMLRSAQRIGEMLDALDPPLTANPLTVDLRAQVAECLYLLRHQCMQVQIEISEGPPLWVQGPFSQIRHVVLSLLLGHLLCKPTQMRITLREGAMGTELQLENLEAFEPCDEGGLAFVLLTTLVASLGGSLERSSSEERTRLTLPSVPS